MKKITRLQKTFIAASFVCFSFMSVQAQNGNGNGNGNGNNMVTMCNLGGNTVNVPSQTVANLLNAGWSLGSCIPNTPPPVLDCLRCNLTVEYENVCLNSANGGIELYRGIKKYVDLL